MGSLLGSTILIFLGLILPSVTGVTATDWNDVVGSSSSLDYGSSSCNFTTLFYTRSTWSGVGEPCNQKLPFEFWIHMKAEGSAGDPDADHVRNECLLTRSIGMVELITPEDWNTTIMDAAPGQLLRETKRAAYYRVESPLDFEAMCTDDQVTKVSRINAVTANPRGSPPRMSKRRLQNTVSVAGNAHGVDALISGLEELGCQRTTGEDQTLCIMSDSFNRLGNLATLQESGDLPPDEFLTIVEELSEEDDSEPSDEGSAMMELAFDIASGANFKFNTFFEGSEAAADDIITLASDEACDVMVDDIGFGDQPGFRDGIIAEAVDEVVADGILYFSSAGNDGNGFKFTSNWECSSDIFEGITDEPCDTGVASHVFNPDATGIERYLLPLSGAPFSGEDIFLLHWDDDEGTSRGVFVELWTFDVSGTEAIFFSRTEFPSDSGTAVVFFFSPEDLPDQYIYLITISQVFTDLEDVEMRLLSWTDEIFSEFSDGSVYGHQCAASTISVAAMDIAEASGVGGRFTDPESSSVEPFSSRGPCYINSGSGLDERLKPVTTAANRLETSTVGFEIFPGTSAAAPVAAAIATIVRAACYPRVVTFTDMLEMLTDYTYTIDVTSDAGGEEETWGVEAGYGIISADQMLGWIAANCQESCPGAATPSPSVPTPAPSTAPTTPRISPPTVPPTMPPVTPRTAPPSVPPTTPPAASPIAPPTTPPITLSPMTPTTPPISPPTMPPTMPPVTPRTAPPNVPPTTPPVAPTTTTLTTPPITMPPIAPPISPPTMPTTQSPIGGLVDASERTLVTATANAYDTRTTGFGCPPNGCVAANTRDGNLSTRWSCKEDLLGGTNCKITFTFEEPQDIVRVRIAFYKGDERTRVLKIKLNGSNFSVIESSGETDGFEEFEVNTDETETLTLEGLELRGEEWISISEVQFLVQ